MLLPRQLIWQTRSLSSRWLMPAGDSSSERVSPEQFERWFDNRKVDLVVMDVCGCALLGKNAPHSGNRVAPAAGAACGCDEKPRP
jgi:hypothetical protein